VVRVYIVLRIIRDKTGMNTNPNDDYRNNFFDELIRKEKEKEKAILKAQRNCPHIYNIRSLPTEHGLQLRTCSKCSHSVIKSVQSWELADNNKRCCIS